MRRKKHNGSSGESDAKIKSIYSKLTMMFTTILAVDKLLQKATEGVDYLRNNFDLFVRVEEMRKEYLTKSKNTYECLEHLTSEELIESFEDEIRTGYFTYHDLNRIISFLNIIDGRIDDLTEALWKFYDSRELRNIDDIDWLTEDDKSFLDGIRGEAKYATVKNYYERPYFLISDVVSRFIPGSRVKNISKDSVKDDENEGVKSQLAESSIKLKWTCKPAIAGFIISELVRAGYVEPPTTNGELSYAKLANICSQIFDVTGKDGNPTTIDYLKKVVNPESSSLPDTKRAKLRLPDLSDLT